MTNLELDKAVADAIGLDYIVIGNDVRYDGAKDFRPWFDWRDAMFAAEEVGLFDPQVAGTLYRSNGKWTVAVDDGFFHGEGPAAICKAIIAVKGPTP